MAHSRPGHAEHAPSRPRRCADRRSGCRRPRPLVAPRHQGARRSGAARPGAVRRTGRGGVSGPAARRPDGGGPGHRDLLRCTGPRPRALGTGRHGAVGAHHRAQRRAAPARTRHRRSGRPRRPAVAVGEPPGDARCRPRDAGAGRPPFLAATVGRRGGEPRRLGRRRSAPESVRPGHDPGIDPPVPPRDREPVRAVGCDRVDRSRQPGAAARGRLHRRRDHVRLPADP